MTHGSFSVHCTRNVLDAIIGYRYFPGIFLVKNWSSIFFKNNTWSEKNLANKYMLKVNKRHTGTICEVFSKLTSKKNIRTVSLTPFECLYC